MRGQVQHNNVREKPPLTTCSDHGLWGTLPRSPSYIHRLSCLRMMSPPLHFPHLSTPAGRQDLRPLGFLRNRHTRYPRTTLHNRPSHPMSTRLPVRRIRRTDSRYVRLRMLSALVLRPTVTSRRMTSSVMTLTSRGGGQHPTTSDGALVNTPNVS